MLSYRHGFHAGNHADVVKHICLLALLQALCKKPTPLCYFETHAGAGLYPLHSPQAQQTREYASGAQRLVTQTARDELLADYVRLLREAADPTGAAHYPGSPWLAQSVLRSQDRLQLCELHPADGQSLSQLMASDPRVSVHRRDGFAAVRALLPPAQSRGLVLIDPAYEIKTDYRSCVDAVVTLRKRFRSACIALWYPRLPHDPAAPMLRDLRALPATEMLRVELDVAPALGDYGMFGSGVLIVAPPWQLGQRIAGALQEAAPRLGSGAQFRIEPSATA